MRLKWTRAGAANSSAEAGPCRAAGSTEGIWSTLSTCSWSWPSWQYSSWPGLLLKDDRLQKWGEVPAPLLPYFQSVSNASMDRRPRQMVTLPEEGGGFLEEGGGFLEEGGGFLEEGQRLRVPEDVREHYMAGKRTGRQIVPGVYSCGHQGSDQFINFINPHYPSHDSVAGTCHFRMMAAEPGVCQIRVDFVDTEMLSPTEGDCVDQYLVISGSTWTTGFNKLCGINPDQHFYIHLDKEVGFQHVDFTITSVTKNVPYKFGLWITQIDCFDGSSVMAPGGCSQLHFGREGILKSFNFEGVQYLNNQNYKSCIRSERGACYIQFQADANHFMLEPVQANGKRRESGSVRDMMFGAGNYRKKNYGRRPNAKAGDSSCLEDFLMIPGGQDSREEGEATHSHDRYCGGFLNSDDNSPESQPVFAKVRSNVFWVQLVTGRRGVTGGSGGGSTFDQTLHGPGVRVRYKQHLDCIDTDIVNK